MTLLVCSLSDDLPTLLVCSLSDDQREKYTSLLHALNGEFSRRFEDFKVLENDMRLVSSPFTFNVDKAHTDLQFELIDLQSDAVIGELFKTMSLTRFYASLDEQNFPKIRSRTQMFVLFGSTSQDTDHLLLTLTSQQACA